MEKEGVGGEGMKRNECRCKVERETSEGRGEGKGRRKGKGTHPPPRWNPGSATVHIRRMIL